MAKYLNRLSARLAREALRESKSWVVSKKLILETDEGDLELNKGDMVDMGATADGDLAVKANGQAAVVVIADADLASKIADTVVSSDELSDVEFVTKDAVDTVLDGEEVDSVVDKMADEDPESNEVEVAQMDVDKKESVESKFAKFANNPISYSKSMKCESIMIDEEDEAPIDMATMSQDSVAAEPMFDYDSFTARVSELGGSVQPGEVEKALDANGQMIGYFDKASNKGKIFPETSFENEDAMNTADAGSAEPLMNEPLEGEETEMADAVEEALSCYESSEMTGADYMKMVEALSAANLKESTISKIAGSFNSHRLVEGCRIYDTKLGKHVCVKESGAAADNWIEEANADKSRFTKRFFG